jgi:hypothetical protein
VGIEYRVAEFIGAFVAFVSVVTFDVLQDVAASHQ